MNADMILERLAEIGEKLEFAALEVERLRNAAAEDDPDAEVMICTCRIIECAMRRASGKLWEEVRDTKRFLNNVRRSA